MKNEKHRIKLSRKTAEQTNPLTMKRFAVDGLTLTEKGRGVVAKLREMEAAGASSEEVNDYLSGMLSAETRDGCLMRGPRE